LKSVFAQARTETERRMLLIWTTTLCRPGQILDLTWDRVDFEEHSIDFNVPNMKITNKRRAKVLMYPTVAAYLEPQKPTCNVVENTLTGAPLKGFKNIIKRMVRRAGLRGSAYRIRKCASSYLTNAGVPTVQVQAMLAHKFADGATWRYNEADLPPVIRHLEALLKELNPQWLSVASEL
jgi:integrase